jgi:hypothetical protein
MSLGNHKATKVRTTVRIDGQLLADAKELAVRTNRSVSAVIETALRHYLSSQGKTGERGQVRLKTFGSNGLRPGVNLDNSASLLDLTEGTADPA